MRELAAVAVGHGSHDDARVLMIVERDFGDLGEVPPGHIGIARWIGAEFVKIDALISTAITSLPSITQRSVAFDRRGRPCPRFHGSLAPC
jgi:hypothetical protein